VLGHVLDGVGVALLGTGVVMGLSARNSFDEAQSLADQRARGVPVDRAEFDRLRTSAGNKALGADILYGVGAVVLGAGLYFTFSGESGEASSSARSSRASSGCAIG
jgi:hypothetical protein